MTANAILLAPRPRTFTNENPCKWQIPDDVVFVESMPLGATGKILKTRLREQLKDYRLATGAAA